MSGSKSKDAIIAKQAAFQFISWMSAFLAICTALVFVGMLFVPNSGTAPTGVIFSSYLVLIAMPIGFFLLYKWSRGKKEELDIELANWDKKAELERKQAEERKAVAEGQRNDENFKKGIWPFSCDDFYKRCEKNNIKCIDSPYAEQKVTTIAKAMLLEAGLSDKCIAEFLTLSKIQKLFDEAIANIQRATAEKERQRKLEEERKRTTPVQSRFYGADQRNFELATRLAKMFGTDKRKVMLEAQAEPQEKELAELESKLAALRDADENKYKNAALIQTIVPQEDKKDWGLAGGIAHGLGGAALGAAVAIDTMRENAEIEARNQARKAQHADLARQIINRDYRTERKEVYAEVKRLETIVMPMREEISLVGDKIVFDGTSTAALSKQIEITNQQVTQHNGHLEVSFFIENNCSTNVTYDVEIVLDGTATAKIYCGEIYVGTAIVALPVYGIAQGQRCRVSGLSSHYLEGKHDYRVEVNFNNLWLMEK